MPPTAIQTSDFAHKKAVQGPGGFGEKVKDWIDYLNSQVAGNPEFNGSFEIDSDADGDPDLWDINIYTGGAYELDTADASHGTNSLMFTHPGGAGNGGGYADSDYLKVSELISYIVPFLLKNSAAGTKVEVVIRCFDKDKIDLVSDQTIYSSVANPTVWTLKFADVTLAAGTRFIKIRLIGGKSDVDVAGTVQFDAVALIKLTQTEMLKDASVTVSKLKLTQGSWSTSIAVAFTAAVDLVEYAHYPEMKASSSGKLRVFDDTSSGGSNTFLNTSYEHRIHCRNTDTDVSITWYGQYYYHAASEQIVQVWKNADGNIISVRVAEKGKENSIQNSDHAGTKIFTHMSNPELFAGDEHIECKYTAEYLMEHPELL